MASHEPLDFALVVGINDYPRYGATGRNLKGAVRDAERFANWVMDTDTGGGVPAGQCRLITSLPDNPMALGQHVVDLALDDLWQAAKAMGGARRFYMFFSGHGQMVDTADANSYAQALCLPHWSPTMPHAAVNTDSYPNAVQSCMPFQEILVFLDCCRVPAIKVRPANTSVGCPLAQPGFELVQRLVFYAAEPTKRAFEGEDADTQLVHGHFTTALIDGLTKGSDRPGGGVSVKDLWEHLTYWVPKLAQDAGHNQQPRCSALTLPDDLVLGAASLPDLAPPVDAAAPPNFEIRFNPWRQGPIRLLNAAGDVLRMGPPDTGPWPVTLDPELHLIVDDGTAEQTSFHFRAAMEGAHVTF